MNLPQLRDALLTFIGIEERADIPDCLTADITDAINTAVQQLWNARGIEVFTNESLTVTLEPGENHIAIDEVQAVITPFFAPARQRHLITLASRIDLDTWEHSHGGTTGNAPQAVCVDPSASNANRAQTPYWHIYVTPTPQEKTVIRAKCVRRLVNYTTTEVFSNTDTALPVPHRHVESLLLPLARAATTFSKYFTGDAAPVRAAAQALFAPAPLPESSAAQ